MSTVLLHRNKKAVLSQGTTARCTALAQNACKIPVAEQFCCSKSRTKFTVGLQVCHQTIGRTRVSIDSNFDPRLLRFRYVAGSVLQMPLLHIPPRLSPQIWRFPLELDRCIKQNNKMQFFRTERMLFRRCNRVR